MIDALLNFVANQAENEVFSGGLALGFLGGALAFATALARNAVRRLASHMLPTLRVDGRTKAFRHLQAWLHDHPYTRRCRNLAVACTVREGFHESEEQPVWLVPGPGSHLLRHRGGWLLLRREAVEADTRQKDREVITLTALSLRRDCLRSFMEELATRYDLRANSVIVHGPSEFGDWEEIARATRRPLSSVITAPGLAEPLLQDAQIFLERRDWYAERGIPWRRGYLFQGPPGTGKTSLIRALASELNMDLAILDLASSRLDDAALRRYLAAVPSKAALVFEDIDAAAPTRESAEAKITLSGLLNALDGVAAAEGRLLFMTTNHPERLDPALIRPGRIDRITEIGPLGPADAGRMVLRFHPELPELVQAVEVALAGGGISAAALQGHLLVHQGDPWRIPQVLSLGGEGYIAMTAGTKSAAPASLPR